MLIDCYNGLKNWASNVKSLLDTTGFSDIWYTQSSANLKPFPLIFKRRIIDMFIQNWSSCINNNQSTRIYKDIKETFCIEDYITLLPKHLYRFFAKIRLSSHILKVETGRYGSQRIDYNQRICNQCNKNEVEDEFHFILICPAYSDIRNRFIRPYYRNRPSMYKLVQLLKSSNKTILKNLAKFLKEAQNNVRKWIIHYEYFEELSSVILQFRHFIIFFPNAKSL